MRYTLILLFIASNLGFSQIVNIENKRLNDKKEGFDGSVDLNLSFTMNSKQLLQIGDKFRVGYTKGRHHGLVVTDHAFVKSNDDSFINRGYEHLRYNYRFKDSGRVSLEVFQQGQFNKIQKINLRLLFGTGIRLNLVDQTNYQLQFGSGFMGEYEELIDFGVSRDILSTSYLSFDGQFSKNIGLNTISYLQPKLIDLGNYRFANETYIRLQVNKYLSVKFIYSVVHDSRNIEGVRQTNYIFKNTLSFRF